jgi:hypothetical protein
LNRSILYFLTLLLWLSFGVKKVYAQKIDTIIHINGNVLKGDFKKLMYGVVTWKMDGMGTISFEEPKISTIISKKTFEIKMDDGKYYFASFDSSATARKVYLTMPDKSLLVGIEDIVQINPIKNNFFSRMTGNFSLGANYSKGSNVATISFSGNLDYRKRTSYFNLTWDTNDTYQGDTLSASKSDIAFGWQRALNNGWSTDVAVSATQNTELGTKLRLGLNLLGIKDLVYNDWNRLYSGAGLNIAQETSYDTPGVVNDLAGLFVVYWKIYKLTTPKIWLDANISYLPYLTGESRYRMNFNFNPSVSIFGSNFKVGLVFYYNYDSLPTSNEAENDDYGLNLQFTYKLH